MDAPGANVRQKTGLNRVILNTGWGGLCRKLEYKTAVEVVNAAYTSQTCGRMRRTGAARHDAIVSGVHTRPMRT